MNIGYSSKLPYDECAYRTRTQTSTDPMIYKLDTNQIWNCKQCFSGCVLYCNVDFAVS